MRGKKRKVKPTLGRAYDSERTNEVVKWSDGKTYKRQKPLKKVHFGRFIDVSFSLESSVKAQYAFIEVDELQPSHLASAQNPLHFIPEAQPRNRAVSASGGKMPEIIAAKLRPSEICEGASAYTGAPITNTRGEVIQGNGRAYTMKFYYDQIEKNGATYKNYFENCQIANFYGFKNADIEKIFSIMDNPVLVRMVDVSDEEAIKLGNFQQKDTEAVSSNTTDTKARLNRIDEKDLDKVINELIRSDDESLTLREVIARSKAFSYLVKFNVIRADEVEKYTHGKNLLNPTGTKFIEDFLISYVFKNSVGTVDYFENMPHQTREGIKKGLLFLLKIDENKRIIDEIAQAVPEISAYHASRLDFNGWANQIDMYSGQSAKERINPTVFKLVKKLSEPKTQSEVVRIFKDYKMLVSDTPATLSEDSKKGLSKKEALQKMGLGAVEKPFVCDDECDVNNDLPYYHTVKNVKKIWENAVQKAIEEDTILPIQYVYGHENLETAKLRADTITYLTGKKLKSLNDNKILFFDVAKKEIEERKALALAIAKAKALKLKMKMFESGLGKINFKRKKQR